MHDRVDAVILCVAPEKNCIDRDRNTVGLDFNPNQPTVMTGDQVGVPVVVQVVGTWLHPYDRHCVNSRWLWQAMAARTVQ